MFKLQRSHLFGWLCLASVVSAATSVPDTQMQVWLDAGGVDLANAYSPIWFFGQTLSQPPCIPTWAFSGSPTTPDIYDEAHKTQPGAQCQYPNVGCNCRNPGVPIDGPAPPFPIYYSYNQCSDTEIRVAYNLFYQKDGAKAGLISTGHDWDWERVILVHGKQADGTWAPSQALLSQHSGYERKSWGDIQNTLTTDEIMAGDAKDPNGNRNNDHPKVYVSWSKHAHFDTGNTGFNDVISQSDGNAFRSQDWWYHPDAMHYIRSDLSTDAGKALAGTSWGDASSNPPAIHQQLCSI